MFEPGKETVGMRDPDRKQPLPIGWFALFTPDDAMERDRGLYVKRRALIAVAGVVVLAMAWGLSSSEGFVEDLYAEGFGQLVGRGLATASGLLSTSMSEVVLVILVGYFSLYALRAGYHVARKKRRLLNAIACGGLSFGAFALVALALFYVFWGLNYARKPLVERLKWQNLEVAVTNGELERLCAELVAATNDSYRLAHRSEDVGVPRRPARTEVAAMDRSIDRAYGRVAKRLSLSDAFAVSRGPAKPVAASGAMNYLMISGYYFPWTGEANYNRLQPDCQLPHTIAHEKAHQRCITSEDEANFFGFLACIHSDDPYVRYSGYLFAQRQLLAELMRRDGKRARELLKRRLAGVQRDVDHLRAYWQGFAGPASEASRTINDAYLKGNGVEGGVANYRLSAKLILLFARHNGGSVVVTLSGQRP